MKPLPKTTRLLICAGLGLMTAWGLATAPKGAREAKSSPTPETVAPASVERVAQLDQPTIASRPQPQTAPVAPTLSYPQAAVSVSTSNLPSAPLAPTPLAVSAPLMPRVTQQTSLDTPAQDTQPSIINPPQRNTNNTPAANTKRHGPRRLPGLETPPVDEERETVNQSEIADPAPPAPQAQAAPVKQSIAAPTVAAPAAQPAVTPPAVAQPMASQPAATPAPSETLPPGPKTVDEVKTTVSKLPGYDVGDDHLVLNIHNAELRQVLELIAEQGGLNILASPSVEGKVSASLRDVTIETALDAILKSTGFISRREDKLIFVGTPEEFAKLRTNLDRVGVRVYRLNYVTAKEMQALLMPLLTPSIGKSTITSAAQTGIAVDATSAGGDSFASGEAVLVQDYEAVLCQLDQIVREIDRKPMQVAIEAVIINVTLNDGNKWGVDFQFLRDKNTIRFGSGTPRTAALDGTGAPDGQGGVTGEFKFTQGGLQFAFLDSTLGAFLTAVETLGDVNVVAHPRLLCLNKQRAEILIGAQIGYITTTTTQTFATQSVQFLDVGTQLRLRPFISNDGIVRMEVHPEISDGSVSAAGVPSKNVTQVTTNIMCPDGSTVVIGGLMQESLQTDTRQIPVIGSMPVVGPLFRTKTENVVRREILVLITPRIIYDPEAHDEGVAANAAGHHGHDVMNDEMTLLSRNHQARLLTRRALNARETGRLPYAWRLAQMAVHFNPNDHEAVALRDELEQQLGGRATVRSGGPLMPAPPNTINTNPVDGEMLSPWLLDELEGGPPMNPALPHPKDPGAPAMIRQIEPVDPLNYARP